MPEVLSLKRTDGIAGQIQYDVTVRYESGTYQHRLIGSAYGTPGPVFVIFEGGAQVRVDSPQRHGDTFGAEWVRRFYS